MTLGQGACPLDARRAPVQWASAAAAPFHLHFCIPGGASGATDRARLAARYGLVGLHRGGLLNSARFCANRIVLAWAEFVSATLSRVRSR